MKSTDNKFLALFTVVGIAAALSLMMVTQWGMAERATSPEGSIEAFKPPFDSTADTVFDIIRKTDPSSFVRLEYIGRRVKRIWDKRVNDEPKIDVFLFSAYFCDSPTIQVAINAEFGTLESAQHEAGRYTHALGQLPTVLRRGIRHFSVHKGNKSFHAGSGQIVVYAEKTNNRLSYEHLEESLFHEAVHASWDDKWRLSKQWVDAQISDGQFLTQYGKDKPEREDLAESALFAYGILHFPGRIPPEDAKVVKRTITNRIEFVKTLIPPGQPILGNLEGTLCNDLSHSDKDHTENPTGTKR